MKPLLFGLFTLVLVFVWIFFVIANIHAKKFSNFSKNLTKVTNFLFIFLFVFSILGYIVIIFGDLSGNSISNFFDKGSSSVRIDNPDFFENINY